MRYLVVLTLSMILLTGCCTKAGRVEFVEVVWNHDEITQETNQAVINSIRAELEERDDLTQDQIDATNDLIDRIKTISRQASVIRQYVDTTEVDQELLAELIRSRWKN